MDWASPCSQEQSWVLRAVSPEQSWAWAQIKDWRKSSDEWKHAELSEFKKKKEKKLVQWKKVI